MSIKKFLTYGPRISLLVAVVAVPLFGFSLFMTFRTTNESVSMIVDALTARVENASQPDIGLQALVKSSLPDNLRDPIKNASVPHKLAIIVSSIEHALSNQPSVDQGINRACVRTETGPNIFQPSESVAKPRPQPMIGLVMPSDFEPVSRISNPSPIDEYITERLSISFNATFLYLPGALIRAKRGVAPSDALPLDEPLAIDIARTRSVATCLTSLDGLSISQDNHAEIVQAFIITSRGMLRLRELGNPDQRSHYANQFRPLTYFARPNYFTDTVKREVAEQITKVPIDSQRKIGELFTVTKPYVDLGGNGVVSTICRPMTIVQDRDSVLCLDVSVADIAESNIRQKLNSLGNTWEGECGDDTDPKCDASFQKYQSVLEDQIKTLKDNSEESDFFGAVRLVSAEAGKMTFVVPLRHSNKHRRKILLARIDLQGLKLKGLLWPSVTLASAVLFLFNVVFFIADHRRRLSVQEATLDRVADVMSAARDAYCRVTQQDKFIDLNDAFAQLVGFDNRNEAQVALRGTTFLDLLDDTSKKKYIEKTRQRLDRQYVEPYEVRLRHYQRQIWVTAIVHGAAVPLPMGPRDSSQTFGILLS